MTAAILTVHLGGSRRVVPAAEFVTEVAADLSLLRDGGFDLPQTAQEYVSDWVRRGGYLIRRPGAGREETVELSAGGLRRHWLFWRPSSLPRTSMTSSRFTNVADLLARLARDTDPESSSRLEALTAERDRLDAEIARVERGEFDPLDAATARERLADILALSGEISTDFARVNADLESLNRELKDRIIRSSAARAEVLEEVFAGVDLIEDSPGRADIPRLPCRGTGSGESRNLRRGSRRHPRPQLRPSAPPRNSAMFCANCSPPCNTIQAPFAPP